MSGPPPGPSQGPAYRRRRVHADEDYGAPSAPLTPDSRNTRPDLIRPMHFFARPLWPLRVRGDTLASRPTAPRGGGDPAANNPPAICQKLGGGGFV